MRTNVALRPDPSYPLFMLAVQQPLTERWPRLTAADLLAIPEAERFHEIIHGELVRKATPTFEHGDAQGTIYHFIFPYKVGGGGGGGPGAAALPGWWLATEVEIELEPHEVYRPDVAGWRAERVPERPSGTPILIRPDWICEVLSPSNTSNDLVKKKAVYHRCQVPHYWIVDPMGQTLAVYRWTSQGYLEVLLAERTERVRAEPFEAVEVPCSGRLLGR